MFVALSIALRLVGLVLVVACLYIISLLMQVCLTIMLFACVPKYHFAVRYMYLIV